MKRTSLNTEDCNKQGKDGPAAAACPALFALSLIANKWTIRIIIALISQEDRTLRFGQIQKTLGAITQRELTKQLRELEKSGLITRKIFPQIPPRVEYTITELGYSLWGPVEQLSLWAEKNAPVIQKNRIKYQASSESNN